ncbi:MAG: LamG-like jellyroll fold domain-containing protein [Acidimicrobiales bacterium]
MSALSKRAGWRWGSRSMKEAREAGMTLIEVLVAVVLLMLVLVPASAFLISGLGLSTSSSVRTTAVSLASSQLSKLRSSLLAYYPTPSPPPPLASGSNPAICNPLTGSSAYTGATACGAFTPVPGSLPATETVGGFLYTISYSVSWASSESSVPTGGQPSSSCASSGFGPYPPAMINVNVTVGYKLHNQSYSVNANALFSPPLNYYNPNYGYVAVYGGPGTSGDAVYMIGDSSPTGSVVYASQLDSNGCAFFINVPAQPSGASPAATYLVESAGGYARTVTVCNGQTSDVPLYAVALLPSAGGFGGCGALSATKHVYPKISVSPTSLTLTNLVLNTPSSSKTITVTDIGNWPLAINSVVITGPDSANFAVTGGSCGSGGATIAPSQTCTISVDFTPTNPAVYVYNANLVINSDAVNNSALAVPLEGMSLDCYEQVVYGYHPTAYWPLTDKIPPTAQDISGNHYNGTMSSGVTVGQPGPLACDPSATSVGMNGTNGYVSTPITGFSPSQLTVEAWVKPSGYTGNPRIVANDHTDAGPPWTKGFQLEINNGGRSGFFDVGNGSAEGRAVWSMSQALPLNQWYFYVGVYNGSSVTAYLDGAEVGSMPFSGGAVAASPYPVEIGYNPAYNGDYFQGDIGQVAIFTTAITQAQVQHEYTTATNGNTSGTVQMNAWSAACYADAVNQNAGSGSPFGPDAFWRLDEQSGNIAYNSSGANEGAQPAGNSAYNYDGTLQGGVSIMQPGVLSCDLADGAMSFSQALP